MCRICCLFSVVLLRSLFTSEFYVFSGANSSDIKQERQFVTEDYSKSHNCETCGKQLRSISGLKQHLLIHTGEKPHVCYVCHKLFRQKGDLNRHLRIHSGQRTHVCQICEKRFTHKCQLRNHMEANHMETVYE